MADGRAVCPHCHKPLPGIVGSDPAAIIDRLVDLASSASASAAQVRANEVLAKIRGMLVEKQERDVTVRVVWTDAGPLSRLHHLRDARQAAALGDSSEVIDAEIAGDSINYT